MLGPGTVLGDRFELTRQLGDGSLGPVWLAQDRVLEETVVLKLLSPHLRARPELLALLKQECRLARRLRHPGIVRVHDFHSDRDHACISMEYVPGQSLSAWRGRPWPELQPLLVDLADALTHAHEMGVVHRDLKPENVQVDPSGRPHLMDFGVAGALEAGAESGAFPGGSPAGMSPQQLAGDPPHPADDVYGFGALIYELVCARPPLALPLDAERIRSEIPQPMHASPPPPAALVDLVSRMLAKGVAERPQDMVRVRAALDALSDTSDNRTLLPDIATATPPEVVAVPISPRPVTTPPVTPAVERSGVIGLVIGALFLVLVLIGVGVFVYLPSWIEHREAADLAARVPDSPPAQPAPDNVPALPAAETVPEVVEVVPQSRPAAAQSAAAMTQAEVAMSAYVGQRDALLEQGANIWASEAFSAAAVVAERADRAWLDRDYATARAAFLEAGAGLAGIEARIPDVLARLLAQGAVALEQGEDEAARTHFEMALRIDPGNIAAQQGLARAEILPQVRERMLAGQTLEDRGEWGPALAEYQQALGLDGEAVAAREAVERLTARIEEQAFRDAMTQGLNALDAGDLTAAAEAFKRAKGLRPDAPDAADGLRRVDARRTAGRISALKRRAEGREVAQDWTGAAADYAEMLKMAPGLVSARQGVERNQRNARIETDMSALMADPRALYPEKAQIRATALIDEVAGLASAPQPFRTQAAQLEARLRVVRTPVPVRLESDSETDVVIYRVGKLGRFDQRQIDLRPGVYTVLGTRRGYRDVRLTLTVDPGTLLPPLVLRCEEPV